MVTNPHACSDVWVGPAWCGGAAWAAKAPVAQQFTLANGMTLIVQPDRRAPTVVHMLWVRVGAMDEVDGTTGVAHALEHMLFKGTPTVPPGEFSRRVAALGGRENAFTTRDVTAYHQQIPSDKLETMMQLEADRFANNQWPDDEFKREIEVIKEERRQRTEESPRARMFEAMNAMVFQASPYRRPVVGWMSDLDAMTPQDARDFYQRWYTPANAAVVIAGDVDVAEVKAMAERIYGVIPAPPGAGAQATRRAAAAGRPADGFPRGHRAGHGGPGLAHAQAHRPAGRRCRQPGCAGPHRARRPCSMATAVPGWSGRWCRAAPRANASPTARARLLA